MKRGIGPMLLMVGLLLGPGYYIVAKYLSGEPGRTFTLTERAARWTLADGTILHFTRGQAYRPVAIDLDPNMNRIGFELKFEFRNILVTPLPDRRPPGSAGRLPRKALGFLHVTGGIARPARTRPGRAEIWGAAGGSA